MPDSIRPIRAAVVGASVAVLAAVLAPAAGAVATRSATQLHDARYCELLVLDGQLPAMRATVWNTIGRGSCPDARWRALDAGQLAGELGATSVILNGPRHFLMDSASAVTGRRRTFDGLRTTEVASIPIRTADELDQSPYVDRTIDRTNTCGWKQRRRVFELVAPGGDTYVMQSYAQTKDPSLTLAKLAGLGGRLKLPAGWRYRSRTLRRPLTLTARRSTTVIQDDLQDTYQLATTRRHAGARKQRAVSIEGRTKNVPTQTPGTLEDHGTISGTPFGDGTVVLVGRIDAGSLTGTVRLLFPRGSILGRVAMPFTISGNDIDFTGTVRFVAGTGVYRGISSGTLGVRDHNTLDGQNGTLTIQGMATY